MFTNTDNNLNENEFVPSENKTKKRFPIFIIAFCILFSCVFGGIGGYISQQIISDKTSTNINAETALQNGVLDQSTVLSVSNNSPDQDSNLTVAKVADIVKDVVVEITTETVTTGNRMGQFIRKGAGSGIIVSSDGNIVTNYHVVSGAKKIAVRLSDGTEYDASLIGCDSKTDLAVIKIQASELTPAVLGDSSAMMVGETVVAVGNPLGELGGTVTSGILSALDRAITIDGISMRLLQTDAAINPGNSGGGLFNLNGELIGIVNAKSSGSDVEGLGFAIPTNTAKHVIESIIENGYAKGRVDMGLTLIEISNVQTAMAYRVNKTGLYVYSSTNNQFKSGDRIVSIDGVEITNLAEYNEIIDDHKVGDIVQITVSRKGQLLTIKVNLTELQS